MNNNHHNEGAGRASCPDGHIWAAEWSTDLKSGVRVVIPGICTTEACGLGWATTQLEGGDPSYRDAAGLAPVLEASRARRQLIHAEKVRASREHAAAVHEEIERRDAELAIALAKTEEERKAQTAKEAEARAKEHQALLDRVAALEQRGAVQS